MELIKRCWKSPTKYSHFYWIFSFIWLLIVIYIAFIWNLGSTGLVDETEPLFAEAARQMTVTGNWITPYFNGEPRFDKPALIYWMIAIGYKLIGVNEWAIRLPSALSAISLVILGFYTLRYFGFTNLKSNNYTENQLWLSAWIGSALISLNPQTIIWGRIGVSDMLLSGCMGSGLFCFFWGYVLESNPNKSTSNNSKKPIKEQLQLPNKWYLSFYILISLAVLAKGPVGIVLPGLIIFCFLIYVNQFILVIREIKLFWGIIVFLLITVPWYWLVFLENGRAFVNSFFGYHNFERFTDVVNGHDAPWYFYFIIILGLFAPWSIYLPLSISNSLFWKYNYWRKQSRQYHLKIFAFWWFICIFFFFTISVTKLPSYILPLIPAAAILVALLWSDGITKAQFFNYKIDLVLLISILGNLLLVLVLAVGFYISPNFIGNDPAIPKLNRLVASTGLTLLGGIIWSIIGVAISYCIILSQILSNKSRVKSWRWIIVINLIGFLIFTATILLPAASFVDTNRQLPLRKISQDINQFYQYQEPIIMVGFKKPSLVFYSQKTILFFKTNYRYQEYWDDNRYLIQSKTSLIIGREKELRKIAKLQPQDYQELSRHSVYKLVRINNSGF